MKAVRGLIIFAVGAAAGFAGGWFASKKKIEDRCDKELEAIRAHYRKKIEADREAYEDSLTKASVIVEKAVIPDLPEKAEKAQVKSGKTYVDYTSFSSDNVEKPKAKIIEPEADDVRKIISYEEFIEETEFNEEVLTYYTWDNILADSYDEIVSADAYVGLSNLELFDRAKHGDSMYVRNTDREEVFEVIFRDASYAEEVLGNGSGGVK